MKRIILIFFLLTGCIFNQSQNDNNTSNINFSDNLTLDLFKFKLEKYSINSPYPNINN